MFIMFKGAKFYSSQEFQQKLKEFEDEYKCSFVFKNSTKSMTDNKSRKRPIDETKFELARGTLVCAHYGTKRLTASKGIRTSAPSQKLQCEAMFSFKYDEWEQCLLIHKCNLMHNHVLDSRLFSQQLKQKKFSLQEKAVLKEVVALNPDNEKLLMMVQKDFQKSLTLHDVRTLKHKSSLQDCYLREKSRQQFEMKLGSAASSNRKKYIFYDKMAFLEKGKRKTKAQRLTLTTQEMMFPPPPPAVSDGEECGTEIKVMDMEDEQSDHPNNNPRNDDNYIRPTIVSKPEEEEGHSPPHISIKGKKRKRDHAHSHTESEDQDEEEMMQHHHNRNHVTMFPLPQNATTTTTTTTTTDKRYQQERKDVGADDNDHDKLFLLSLHHDLNTLPDHVKPSVKGMLLGVLSLAKQTVSSTVSGASFAASHQAQPQAWASSLAPKPQQTQQKPRPLAFPFAQQLRLPSSKYYSSYRQPKWQPQLLAKHSSTVVSSYDGNEHNHQEHQQHHDHTTTITTTPTTVSTDHIASQDIVFVVEPDSNSNSSDGTTTTTTTTTTIPSSASTGHIESQESVVVVVKHENSNSSDITATTTTT